MSRIVERIEIKANKIKVEGLSNGVKSFYSLSPIVTEKDMANINIIMDEYNFIGNRFDINIIKSLIDPERKYIEKGKRDPSNEEQLKYYLNLCSNTIKAKDIPIEMPKEVIYDIDKKMTWEQQLKFYNQAKETQELLKTSKVRIKMGVLQKSYMLIQKLLHFSEEKPPEALNPGLSNFRENLYDEVSKTRADEVSKKYAENTIDNNDNNIKSTEQEIIK